LIKGEADDGEADGSVRVVLWWAAFLLLGLHEVNDATETELEKIKNEKCDAYFLL
jgi:hypothetical protein